jgi:2-polyprenyl-6-methoxyphenol hydroxylase-like FAD-dependent oxidoreductase
MAEPRTAAVVGGGIAGLAAAVSLSQAGWQTIVLERAPEFGEVGAGLAITGNGMAALQAIGAAEETKAAGYQTRTAGYQDPRGRWLLRIPDAPSLGAVTTIWGIHRQRLHAAVLAAARIRRPPGQRPRDLLVRVLPASGGRTLRGRTGRSPGTVR